MRNLFLCVLLSTLALAATGCGKSKSSTNPDAAEAAARAGDQALANADLAGANAHYKDAIAKDPANPHANLGAAIASLGLLQADPAVDSLITLIGELPLPAPAARAARSSRILSHIGIQPGFRFDPFSNGRALARLYMRGAANLNEFTWAQNVIKNTIMPELQYAEDRLTVVRQHPTWSYLIPTSVTGLSFPLEADLGEALALDAVVNSLQGVLGTLIAYDFDAAPDATDADLLASTTFGTLHTDGAAQLGAARANLLVASTRFAEMETSIRAEGDDQSDDVIPVEALDAPGAQDAAQAFADMAAALSGTVQTDVTTWDAQIVTVSVSAGTFFTSPITDLKTMLPTNTTDACNHVVVTNPVSFPYPTFNGVFPGMTNIVWQSIIGTVAPPTCVPPPRSM